ncbi:MAG: pseudouridine synthase [Rikenellaceae bacterium]
MKDFKKDSSAQVARFGRDKRDRGSKPAFEERRPRLQRDATDGEQKTEKRASYNPRFTADNRPMEPRGERRSYGDRPGGFKKSYGDKKPGGKRSFGDKPAYGDSERKSYGDKPAFKKSYGDKPSRDGYRPRSKNRDNEGQQQPSYPKYDPNRQTSEIRLNRFLAQSGVASRREADEFIKAGVVSVNGVIVTELGTKVKPTDEVKFNDSRIQGEKRVYLVLNKPKGYVTSLDDPHADKTVMDLVGNACSERIYPVGRLDKNSVGLLLFTNDGDLTKQLTHPSHKKKKIYQVSLDKPLTRADMDSIAEGVTLEDGDIYADEISYVSEGKDEVGIEIHSGRNRIVRRIFEHLGYSVQKLDRVYFAGLTKKNLKRGQWRFLTPEEVDRLKSGRYE